MSGLDIIGGISAVIGIIDACVEIYETARKDMKLSETFRTVAHRLPIISDTLPACKRHFESREQTLTNDVIQALEAVLTAVKRKPGLCGRYSRW
jgi:hypothetical protein